MKHIRHLAHSWRDLALSILHSVASNFSVLFLVLVGFTIAGSLQAADPPSITITSPSSPVAVSTGQSRQFNAAAAAAGGLKGIEWFVGASSERYTSYTATWDYYQEEAFSYTFSSPGTYYVSAYVYDRSSPQQEDFVIWQVNVSTPPPSAPTGVSASDGSYTDKVRVTWNSVSSATSYEVWRHTSNSSGSATKISSPNPTGTTFDDTTAVAGTTYYYWIKAKNAGGTSGFSSSNSGYRQVSPPSAPTGVSASDGSYTDKVRVTWNSASGATSYEVWRHTSNSSGSATKISSPTGTTFDDTTAVAGATYYYWIKAKNAGGTSGFSTSNSGLRQYAAPDISALSPPSPITVDSGQSTQFSIEATATAGLKGIEWFVGTSSERYTSYTATWDYYQEESFSYTFSSPGTYYVSAYVYDRSSPQQEDFVIWQVNVSTPPPSAPTGVSASDGSYTDKVRVTWNSVSSATSYEVWRHTSNSSGSATKISSPNPTGTAFDDTTAVAGTSYYYWIKAKNAGGTSGFSATDSGYRLDAAPTIAITAPATPIVIEAGISQQFGVEATAAQGLKGIEWFVGTSSERYTSYTATWDYYQEESFSYAFSSPGSYYVSAYVYDRSTPQQEDFVIWEVVVEEGSPPVRPSREFFDDFSYSNPDDPSFVGFGWHVRTGLGGPGVSGATWSDERVSFVDDSANPGGRLMKLTAATSGNATSTEHVEVSTGQRFFEGTYAVRARLSDSAATGISSDGIVQAPLFTINSLQFDNDPDYSELDFEYLPNDVWSGGTRSGPTMYCTSWETYQNSPWLANNTHTPLDGPYSGWHTFVFQVADGHIQYYIDGSLVASHGGDYYPESLMSIMTQLWFVNGELSPATSYREWEMEIDWVYHGEGVAFTAIQVETIVDEIRGSSIARLDTFVEPTLDISVSASPSAGGSVSGGGTFDYGTSQTVVASANTGYDFVRWTEGGSQVSANPSYTFTLTSNRNLVAEFVKETRTISISASPSAGGSVSGGGTFDYSTSRTVTASANTGYDFVRWTEGGAQVSANPSYTFTLTSNRNLVAEFVKETRTISISASPSAGGSVSGGGTFDYGTSRTVTASAITGYDFVRWTDGGFEVSTNPSYTFTLTSNRSLVAEFAAQEEFKVIAFHGSPTAGYTIEWTAVPGYSYQVKFSSSLRVDDWNNVGPTHQPPAGQSSMSYTDYPASGTTKRFYKVERTLTE